MYLKKKKVFALSMLIVFALSFSNAFASNDNFNKINKELSIETIDEDASKADILDSINSKMKVINGSAKGLNWKKTPSKNGEFYKIYVVIENLRQYEKGKNINKLISPKSVIWETPVFSEDDELISTIHTKKTEENGKWITLAGNIIPIEYIKFYTNPQNLKNLLTENGIEKPNEVKHIRVREIYTDFFYVRKGNDEYGIPFSSKSEDLGITNLKVYKLSDLISKLSVGYADPNKIIDSNHGGSSTLDKNFMTIVFISGIGLFLIVGMLIVVRKRKIA